MGILNVTPDSFSGDGLLAASGDPVEAAVATGRRMVAEGADILDIGGESTRPGHAPVAEDEERRRVVPVIAALRAALPDTPLSIDTTKPAVAEAALAAGADLVNDVWAVGEDESLARLAADHGVPLVVMHNRAEARYTRFLPELIADLQRAIERALRLGVRWDDLIVDPGFGFGKTADHNLELLRELGILRLLGRPILLGTSRKSTLGRVLGPAARRASRGDAGDDRARDRRGCRHRPRPRRAGQRAGGQDERRDRPGDVARADRRRLVLSDRIVLANMQFQGRHGYYDHELLAPQPFEVDVELVLNLQPAGVDDDLEQSVDYGKVYEAVRQIVESTSFRLLEALAEAISHELLADFEVSEVIVRVRKPEVRLERSTRLCRRRDPPPAAGR